MELIQIGKDKSKADISKDLGIDNAAEQDVIDFAFLVMRSSYILNNLNIKLGNWLREQPRMSKKVIESDRLFLPAGSIPKSLLKKHLNEYLWDVDKSCAYVVRLIEDDKVLDEYAIIVEIKKRNTSMIDRYIIYSTK